MYFSDIITRSGRSLRSAKLRTLLTALAIAVGAFTLSITLAASNGLHDYTSKLIKNNFDPSELIVARDKVVGSAANPSGVPQEYDESVSSLAIGGKSTIQIKRVSLSDVDQMRTKDYLTQVRENYQINIRYVTRADQKKLTGSAEAYNPSQKPEISGGTVPSSGDIPVGTILLPASYVKLLGFANDQAAVGQTIELDVQQPFSIES